MTNLASPHWNFFDRKWSIVIVSDYSIGEISRRETFESNDSTTTQLTIPNATRNETDATPEL